AQKKDFAELKNNAETLIYTTERAIEEYGSMLSDDEQRQIAEDLRYAKDVSDVADMGTLREALRRLEASSHRIAEVMYEAALKVWGGEGWWRGRGGGGAGLLRGSGRARRSHRR